MKKKIIVLTLCFTILFSSINIKKSYADAGILSAPMLATIATVAVSVGIHISTNDDLVDIGRIFYDSNSSNWNEVYNAFEQGIHIAHNGLVTVSDKFLSYCKVAFDNFFNTYADINDYDSLYIPGYGFSPLVSMSDVSSEYIEHIYGDFTVKYRSSSVNVYYNGKLVSAVSTVIPSNYAYYKLVNVDGVPSIALYHKDFDYYHYFNLNFTGVEFNSAPSFVDYNWDSVSDRLEENGSLGLYVPGNLDSLVGLGSSDVFNPSYDLPIGGSVNIPDVLNPSISYETTGTLNPSIDSDSPGIDSPGIDSPGGVLPEFPYWGEGLDFSPITESDISDKFPFCLAKDLSNLIGVFDVGEKEPVFDVPFLGEVYTIDLAQFTVWADIIKFFTLITFIFGLIKITRGIIG